MINKLHLEGEDEKPDAWKDWKEVNFGGGSASGRGRGTGIMAYKDYRDGRSRWGDSCLYNGGGDDMGDCDLGGRGFD